MMSSGWQTGNPSDLDVALPRVLETLDAIRREDQVQIERTVLELHEVLAAPDLGRLLVGQLEAELAQRATSARRRSRGDFSTKRSASCVVSGKPSRMAPDLPRNR